MTTYKVHVTYTEIATWLVEADSKEEAIKKAKDTNNEDFTVDYEEFGSGIEVDDIQEY